jgi:hypothetical protein
MEKRIYPSNKPSGSLKTAPDGRRPKKLTSIHEITASKSG